MNHNYIFGFIATFGTLAANIPYVIGLFCGSVRPHFFSWLIWGFTTGIAFSAQLASHAGAGAWATGAGTFAAFAIALLALLRGEKNITLGDKLSFMAALVAVILWLILRNPLYSVILVTAIDAIGYYPTMRKSHNDPYHESATTFSIMAFCNFCTILALENNAPVNWLYPLGMTFCNASLVILILLRRQTLHKAILRKGAGRNRTGA